MTASTLVTELLRAAIAELRNRESDFAKLLIAEAVREAAAKLHYTTLADVRKRLKAVPGAVLDKTLLTLEKDGIFQLVPSYNGNVLTPQERAGGIQHKTRGNLVYAVPRERVASSKPVREKSKARRGERTRVR